MKKILLTIAVFVSLSIVSENASAMQTFYGQSNVTPSFGGPGNFRITCSSCMLCICYTRTGNTIFCGGDEYLLMGVVNPGHPAPEDPSKNVGSIIDVQLVVH